MGEAAGAGEIGMTPALKQEVIDSAKAIGALADLAGANFPSDCLLKIEIHGGKRAGGHIIVHSYIVDQILTLAMKAAAAETTKDTNFS